MLLSTAVNHPSEKTFNSRPAGWLVAALLVMAGLAAYTTTFNVPFMLDDTASIPDNGSLRSLGDLGAVLNPPANLTVSGRPVLNLSLALNYALSGNEVWSYHALNLLIHLGSGLLLFGLLRRTLARPAFAGKLTDVAPWLAGLVAALWLLHPLQTEAVTYIIQRAESLMAFFYLLTLYCFVRGVEVVRGWFWFGAAITACLLGMGTKEVMVSAPLIVLLYDRTFVAGSFREALRRRGPVYAGLAGTWLLLLFLVTGGDGRGGSAGLSTDVSSWHYALTQCRALVHYLRLTVWPHPLIFDYGTAVAQGPGEVWPQAVLVLGLLGASGWALVKKPMGGFLAVFFFAVLAPSSSFVPVATQTMAEHRMYLPLAAVLAGVVAAVYLKTGRGALWGLAVLALVFGVMTFARNQIYMTSLGMWRDVVAKAPDNARAHYNLGEQLIREGHRKEGIEHYEISLRIDPNGVEVYNNLGVALVQEGRLEDAVRCYERALAITPDFPLVQRNMGDALAQLGRFELAIPHFLAALRLQPKFPEVNNDLGGVYLQLDRMDEAADQFEQALREKPDLAEAHSNLGYIFLRQGRFAAAIPHYERVLAVQPADATAHSNLGFVLLQLGQGARALPHFEEVARQRPGDPAALSNLAGVLLQLGRATEAVAVYERLLSIDPQNTQARDTLRRLRSAR